jgi:hypothetical protein
MMEMIDEMPGRVAESVSWQEWPSMEEWLLDALQRHGMQTLDQLGLLLPAGNWAQLFLALDRLSRSGSIVLWSNGRGEYLARVKDRPYHSE